MISLSNGYFGLYNFGYLGAAIGNGISYLLGALILIMIWSLGYLKSSPTNLLIYDQNRTKQIFKIGYPSALEQIIFQVGITAFLILIAYYGTAAYAAYGIVVWACLFLPIAVVSSIRETSILFAILLGLFFLKEKINLIKSFLIVGLFFGLLFLRVG